VSGESARCTRGISLTATRLAEDTLVHPRASIDPTAEIEAGAIIEEDAVVGPQCRIGAGTRVRRRAMIIERTTIGRNNDIHPYAVLGGDPQDRAFSTDHPGQLIIGDNNIFREGTTIHRGTHPGPDTRIGDGNYFMCHSHAGHNTQVGDSNTIGNSTCLAGHAILGNGNTLSGWVGIHQFVRVGDGVMFQAGSAVSQHVPPFVIVHNINSIAGLNAIGLRRNKSMDDQDRREIKMAYRLLYRTRGARPMVDAVEELRAMDLRPAARRFVDFFHQALNEENPRRRRGVCGGTGGRASRDDVQD
jgi:UDP-N-acetylglucosamine acyltransferase